MTVKRYAAVCAVAFLVEQILDVVIHGFLLRNDYAPFYGTLLRSAATPAMALLPLAHLSFILALVWVYGRSAEPGRRIQQGVRLGILAWMLGEVPVWLQWYAEQPWPGTLVVKQLILELIASLIVGLSIAALAKPTAGPKS
jgi:hypothetical protein